MNRGNDIRLAGVHPLRKIDRGPDYGVPDPEADIGHYVAHHDGALRQSLAGEVTHGRLGGDEQQVRSMIGQDAVSAPQAYAG